MYGRFYADRTMEQNTSALSDSVNSACTPIISRKRKSLGLGLSAGSAKKKSSFRTPFKSSVDSIVPNCTSQTSCSTPQSVSLQTAEDNANVDTPNISTDCSNKPSTGESASTPKLLQKKAFVRRNFKSPFVSNSTASAAQTDVKVIMVKKLTEAKEELRRLKLVEYHRKHNDLSTLSRLTEKWREAGHQALHELHDCIHCEPKPTKEELLQQLRIPLEHFNCDCDD